MGKVISSFKDERWYGRIVKKWELYEMGLLYLSIEQNRSMQRFLTDTTEELTQRNLKSPRGQVNVQSQLIHKLQRENLYLKNQLFAMVHNSGVYDMYLPTQALLCESYLKNGRNLSSPHHWTPHREMSSSANESQQPQHLTRRHCFSPRVQSNCTHTPINQLLRAKSPQFTADFHKKLASPRDFPKKQNDLTASPHIYGTIKSQNHSPARVTPKQSSIFTTQPSQGRLNVRDMSSCQQARDKVNQLKRNSKSPSFLKNRQAFKENVRQSLSNIMKEFQNHRSLDRKHEEQSEDYGRRVFLDVVESNVQIVNKQGNTAKEEHSRNKSKSITIQYSQGDSCLSIQRRLRQILYDSKPTSGNMPQP